MRMERIGNMVFRMFGCVALSVVVGTLLMIAVYALPTEPMVRHVRESADRIELEGKPSSMISWAGDFKFAHTLLNPWSDHIMLMQAIYPTSDSVVQDAMLNRRWLFAKGDMNTTDALLRNLDKNAEGNAELIYQQFGAKIVAWLSGAAETDAAAHECHWHTAGQFLHSICLDGGGHCIVLQEFRH